MMDVISFGTLDVAAATAQAAHTRHADAPIVQRSAQTDTDPRSRPR
jgi:hypothetical protein